MSKSKYVEPIIRIDGQLLTSAQSTVVRVAVTSFLSEMRTRKDMGDIQKPYIDRLEEVETLLVEGVNDYWKRYDK